jgi:hypothetical protein
MAAFPNDADGDALRRVSTHADMSKPMVIDFAVDAPSQASAERIARLASERGYAASVEPDAEHGRWTCYCSKLMMATHEGVLGAQQELDELSAPLGGRSDGWGTSGN